MLYSQQMAHLGTLFLHVLHDVSVLVIILQLRKRDSLLEPDNVSGSWHHWGRDVGHVHVRHVHAVRLGLHIHSSCQHSLRVSRVSQPGVTKEGTWSLFTAGMLSGLQVHSSCQHSLGNKSKGKSICAIDCNAAAWH